MPTKLVHRRNLMPLVAPQRHAHRRHRRSVRCLRHRRTANADRPARPSRAGQPARDHPAHQDPLRRRRRNRHRHGRRNARRRRAARRARGRRQRNRQAGPGSVGRQAGQRNPHRGRQRAGQRHPHRAGRDRACASATASTACCTRRTLPPEINRFQAAIISRIKIMARLNIAEKRLPQDGRIKMRVNNREIDVRVSIIPMIHGEGIVMRLLGQDAHGVQPQERRHARRDVRRCSRRCSIGRTASSWSPGRPARARAPRSTRALNEIKEDDDEDHHGRRPGRVSAGGHQPDSGAPQDRPDVRGRACAASCGTTRT